MQRVIEIPDDADPQYADQLVDALQAHLSGEPAFLMLRRPPGIPDEHMPALVARLVVAMQIEAVRHIEGVALAGG